MLKFLPLILILSLSACADIDKGLYSLSEAVAPADRVTGKRTLNFSDRARQIRKSDANAIAALKKMRDANILLNADVDKKQYERIKRVFKKVHSVSHLRNEKWKVILLPDPSFNAFTLGGTYIFVHKGLMDEIKSDDELAAIIGHEIAHVTANHIGEQESYLMAATLKGSKGAKRKSFQSAFTFKNEEEADEIGALYAVLAGYDPYAVSKVWKRMYEKGGDFSAMTIDHPINSERYKRNKDLAEIYKKYYIPKKKNPEYKKILKTNEVFGLEKSNKLEAGKGGGFLAILEVAVNTMNKHYEAKAQQYDQIATEEFIKYVSQEITFKNLEALDSHELEASFIYKGSYPIKKLSLIASINKETAIYNLNETIYSFINKKVSFNFPDIDLNEINLKSIEFFVNHAER